MPQGRVKLSELRKKLEKRIYHHAHGYGTVARIKNDGSYLGIEFDTRSIRGAHNLGDFDNRPSIGRTIDSNRGYWVQEYSINFVDNDRSKNTWV